MLCLRYSEYRDCVTCDMSENPWLLCSAHYLAPRLHPVFTHNHYSSHMNSFVSHIGRYFPPLQRRADVLAPFVTTSTLGQFDVLASIRGGGLTGVKPSAVHHKRQVVLCKLCSETNFGAVLRVAVAVMSTLNSESPSAETLMQMSFAPS